MQLETAVDIEDDNKRNEMATKSGSVPLDAFTRLGGAQVSGATSLLPLLISPRTTLESQEFQYSINRLIRGIASSRQSAREGYFCALTILLKYRSDITVTLIFEKLNEELKIGSLSKSETGEICIGRILTCGAILRSVLFLNCSDEERSEVIKTLFNASGKKAYLGLLAYGFVTDFIKRASEQETREKLWPHICEILSNPLNEHSLDSLYCLLVISESCPTIIKKHCKKAFKISSLICDETLSIFCEKLISAPIFSFTSHPIYEAFGKELAKSDCLVKFWNEQIEPRLGVQNENRMLIALTILEVVLKNIGNNSSRIPHLLGDRFIPCILEWFKGFQSAKQSGKMLKFKGKQKYFVQEDKGKQIILKSKELFIVLQNALKEESVSDDTKLEVLKKLLFYPGDMMFCDITNSRIIKILIEDLKVDGVRNFSILLKGVILNESKKQQSSSERSWTAMEKSRAADMLTYLINHRTTVDNVKWRIKNMQFFIQIGLFRKMTDGDVHVSSELAGTVKKCFFRCLTSKLPKLESLLKILTSLVDFIDDGINKNTAIVSANSKTFSPVILDSWKTMRKFSHRLKSCKASDAKMNMVFQILCLHSGLFLFSDVMDVNTAKNSLEEIQNCYNHYMDDSNKKKKKAATSFKEGEVVEIEPEWTEVLVDVFLSFLSRDSYLLRTVVQCVFKLLCEYLTPSAIGQIMSVLDPDNDSNILTEKENESEESDEDEEDAEEDEDVEKDEDSEEDKMDEDLSEDEDDNEADIKVNDQFRMAVQKALGFAAPDTDTESVDIDDITEEEGNRLDDALSGAFKMLRQSKGEMTKKDKKNLKTVMEFRIRVLDLVMIYLEKNPSMDVCLGMLTPLFKCLEFSLKDNLQKQLEEKLRKCLKCLYCIKSFTNIEDITKDILAEYLKSIIEKGNRTQFIFQALGDVITKCSTFIVKCSQKLVNTSKSKQKSNTCPIVEIYKNSLEAFFTRRDCLLPVIFFHDILNSNWEGNWILLDTIIDKTFDSEVRQFRKNEGLEMINVFYTNLKRHVQTDCEISVKLKELEDKFSDNIIEYLNDNDKPHERFFTIIMKVLISIKKFHNSGKLVDGAMKWKAISEAVQSSRKQLKLKNTQEYFKLCNLLNLEKIKNVDLQKKESMDSGHESSVDEELVNGECVQEDRLQNGNSNADTAKTKKKKKTKNVSKKESKMLRAQISSEGLKNFSFSKLLNNSNINLDEIQDDNLSEEETSKKKRKNEELIGVKPKKSKKQLKSN